MTQQRFLELEKHLPFSVRDQFFCEGLISVQILFVICIILDQSHWCLGIHAKGNWSIIYNFIQFSILFCSNLEFKPSSFAQLLFSFLFWLKPSSSHLFSFDMDIVLCPPIYLSDVFQICTDQDKLKDYKLLAQAHVCKCDRNCLWNCHSSNMDILGNTLLSDVKNASPLERGHFLLIATYPYA